MLALMLLHNKIAYLWFIHSVCQSLRLNIFATSVRVAGANEMGGVLLPVHMDQSDYNGHEVMANLTAVINHMVDAEIMVLHKGVSLVPFVVYCSLVVFLVFSLHFYLDCFFYQIFFSLPFILFSFYFSLLSFYLSFFLFPFSSFHGVQCKSE